MFFTRPFFIIAFTLFSLQLTRAQDLKYKHLIEQHKFKDTAFFQASYDSIMHDLTAGNDREKVCAYLALAQIMTSRNKDTLILTNYFEALSLAKKLNQQDLLYWCYFKIGGYYYLAEASPATTIKYLYNAKRLFYGDKKSISYYNLLKRIAFIEISFDNYDLAENTYKELLKIPTGEIKEKDQATLYNNISVVYLNKKNYALAEEYLGKSLELAYRSADSLTIARSIMNLGTVNRDKLNYEKALDFYNRAYRIQKNNQSADKGVECLIYIGIVNCKMARYTIAVKQLEEAWEYSKKNEQFSFLRRLLPYLSESYFKAGQFTKAFECEKELNAIEKDFALSSEKETIRKYNEEYSFEKRLVEDSLRYAKNTLELKFENERQLALKDESQKRNLLILCFGLTLVLIIAYAVYTTQKQKSNIKLKISEIKALQAQMNPHFIFNSLNSVLEFISRSEKEEAIKYLTKFSRLIRLVLEFSNRNTIALAEELELLRLYIDLENIRSENSFSYTLEIQEGVDIQNYEVHSMLLQPFVENSIIHGIQNKAKLAEQEKMSYHGELKIVLMLSEASLKCVIEDNGVGIEKAQEIKSNKSFNHLSLGMRITKDRLDLIGERISKLEYIDLKDEQGNSAGTRVEILIPLFERF